MAILKLTTVEDRDFGETSHDVWISTAHITRWYRLARGSSEVELSDWSRLSLVDGTNIAVMIAPDDLAALIDPENACPEPGRCGYPEYLAYRKDGERSGAGSER